MKVVTKLVADLIPYVRNSRTHSDAQVAQIAASIKEFGWTNPILIDGENGIIAGHGRLLAARKLGQDKVPVIELAHLSEAQKRAYVIADNQLAMNAGWDTALLTLELVDLKEQGFDLDLLGFDASELEKLLEPEQVEGLTDEDAVPEAPVEPKTKLGDIYQLGNHRLMCGDSTSIDAVEELMDGQKADMVFTDPPYGIAYKSPSGSGMTKRGDYDVILGDETTDIAKEALNVAAVINAEIQVFWGANHYSDCLPNPSACWLVWDKREGEQINNNSDCELAWVNKGGSARLFHHKWNGMIKASEQKEKRVHPTQKPIALAEWSFETLNAGKMIIDLFGGSGSTLIACEKTNRHAMLMELDPKYCDVIVKRWEDFTGKKAVLLNSQPSDI